MLLLAVLGAPKGFSILPKDACEDQPRFTADNLCLCALRFQTESRSKNGGIKEPSGPPPSTPEIPLGVAVKS